MVRTDNRAGNALDVEITLIREKCAVDTALDRPFRRSRSRPRRRWNDWRPADQREGIGRGRVLGAE
jgi:hypothetical protein